MRATGSDIVELFGYSSDDCSAVARAFSNSRKCPITNSACSKGNHDQSEIYGTCAVSRGSSRDPGSEIIICPTRLYAESHLIFSNIASDVWGRNNRTLIINGTLAELSTRAAAHEKSVIAFGQRSGRELQVSSFGKMSMDWVLQAYDTHPQNGLTPVDFVGVEVQSLDITNNYRDNWQFYMEHRDGLLRNTPPPNSEHGFNWANVYKRLIPQLLRKGNIYSKAPRCRGMYFVLPEGVFERFARILGPLPAQTGLGSDNLSIMTYSLGPLVGHGQMRSLVLKRTIHYSFSDVKEAFVNYTDPQAPINLDQQLRDIL